MVRLTPNQLEKFKCTIVQLKSNGNFHNELIKDYQDVIKYKKVLKYSKYNEKLFERILDMTINLIQENKRFRKQDILSILKNIYKRKNKETSNSIANKIFFIYKKLIFKVNEPSAWSLSLLLKNQILSDEKIKWLIDNAEKSVFILNRILKYPKKSEVILNWAVKNVNKKLFKERKSNIIGFILDYKLNFTVKDKRTLIWGVYHSHLSDSEKKNLLENNLNNETFDDFLKISARLEYVDLIEKIYLINKIKN